MLYLVHGEDEFRRSEWLAEIRQTVALDEGLAALNTVTLNGQRLTPEDLEAACGTAPFMADKRLVIVEGLAARVEPRQGPQKADSPRRTTRTGPEKRMAEYLSTLPPTTDVVLAESRGLSPTNIFMAVVTNAGGRVIQLQLPKPDSQELRRWVAQRAHQRDVQLAPEAIDQLMAFAGNNLRLLDQELAKLAVYADGRPLMADDVRLLVSYAREASVFEMVDALGKRDARNALRKLHELLDEGAAPAYLHFMMARQVRMLIQTRDLLDRGLAPSALANELGVHRYVAQKVGDQARNFSLAGLQVLHRHLVEADWAVKTGRLDPGAALDLLIASADRR